MTALTSFGCTPRPDLEALLRDAVARFEALSPSDQQAMRAAQRKSWVVGEMMLAHPEMTRAYAAALYDRVCA